MGWLELLLLALALSADAFTVAAAVGLTRRGTRCAFRIVFHFGLFQALFALLGAIGGLLLFSLIENWDHWLVFGLLTFVGGRMLWAAWKGEDESHLAQRDLTRGAAMVGLSIAVSIDALAAGISLPTVGANIPVATLVIGLTTSVVSLVGWRLAGALRRAGRRAVLLLGGTVLIGIGVRTVLAHLGLF